MSNLGKIFKNLRNSIKEPLIIYTTGIIITILSFIFFTIKGYPLVATTSDTLDIITPPIYMISIFLPYGILIGEVVWMWNEKGESQRFVNGYVPVMLYLLKEKYLDYLTLEEFSHIV